MATLRRAACAIGLAVIAGCAAPGAVIRGTLNPPGGAAGARRDAGEAGSSDGLSEAVIYVGRVATTHPPRPPSRALARLAMAPGGFEPREVTIARGDSLVLENHDQRWHSPFSVSTPKRFEVGSLPPGRSHAVRFDRSGVVQVFCKLHSEPSAIVFVAPSAVWAHPDATGAFVLPALPPGEYDIGVWHPRYGERRRHVVLTRRGLTMQMRL